MKKQNCAMIANTSESDSRYLTTDETELFTTAKIAAGLKLTLRNLPLWQPPLAMVPSCHCNSSC